MKMKEMEENERRWRKMLKKEKKKQKKMMKRKKNEEIWIHTQNPLRFPGFTVVVVVTFSSKSSTICARQQLSMKSKP